MLLPSARSLWKVLLGAVASLEILYVYLAIQSYRSQSEAMKNDEAICQALLLPFEGVDDEDEFPINYTFVDRAWDSTRTIMMESVFVWIGPVFCFSCLIEAIVRAVEARRAARDSRALAKFERTLLQAARRSNARMSTIFQVRIDEEAERRFVRASRIFRTWISSVVTLMFWICILPTDLADFEVCISERLNDSAIVTKWIVRTLLSIAEFKVAWEKTLESIFWNRVLPYRPHKEPLRFIGRLQEILRIIRFLRFATPMGRMFLKTQDQLRAVWKARKQRKRGKLEKQKRIDRPSMVLLDIERLKGMAKEATALAKLPSFTTNHTLERMSSSVMATYKSRREWGKKLTEQLSRLQRDYFGDVVSPENLYERVLNITHDVNVVIENSNGYYNHRYLKSVKSLLTSRKYLISPRTRFSLAWRVTVTNCLMLEITRLSVSWRLSNTVMLTLSEIIGRLLVECKAPEQTKNQLAFIATKINVMRRNFLDAFPIFGEIPADVGVCIPSGPQDHLLLTFGKVLELFVDFVAFADIFIWFSTGDIDAKTHSVIPKPFFTRCILPGTLVQVLDHPTLPDLLPELIRSIAGIIATVGPSRCIRWVLAIAPVLKMLLIDPARNYFFSHVEEDDPLMNYAASVGMLTPERKSAFFGTEVEEPRFSLYRSDSDAFATSQVGLFVDDDSVNDIVGSTSMISSDVSPTSSLHLPSFAVTSKRLIKSGGPPNRQKNVHFGLSEDGVPAPTTSAPEMSPRNKESLSEETIESAARDTFIEAPGRAVISQLLNGDLIPEPEMEHEVSSEHVAPPKIHQRLEDRAKVPITKHAMNEETDAFLEAQTLPEPPTFTRRNTR